MPRMRLREDHPLVTRFNELAAKADELGLRLVPVGNGGMEVVDVNNGRRYELRDIEDDGWSGTHHVEFPPQLDFKINYDVEDE